MSGLYDNHTPYPFHHYNITKKLLGTLFNVLRSFLFYIKTPLQWSTSCWIICAVKPLKRFSCVFMLYTISTYDCLYTGEISRNGDICIPLPHHAGCLDFASISIEIFDLWFNNACEEYRENGDFCF